MRVHVPIFLLILVLAYPGTQALAMDCAKQVIGGIPETRFELNKLTIIGNHTILWNDEPVVIYRTNGMKVKHTQTYVRLMRALASRAYETISRDELGGEYVKGYLCILRYSLKRADPSFDAIKTIWREGFMWDDGLAPLIKLNDIPQIEFNDLLIRWNGKPVDLTSSQREVVTFLLARRGHRATRAEVYSIAHGRKVETMEPNESDAFKAYMYAIREAFRAVDEDFDRIKTAASGDLIWTNQGKAGESFQP